MPTQGTLADLDLLTLTQILCLARRPAALELRCEHTQGRLYFEHGQLVHATLDRLEGEPALLALLRWQSGDFQVLENLQAPCHTLSLPWAEVAERLLQLPPAL
ncbi:MAG: DUF4388 domain-containing protein [Chloracidobacterium sp.]|nr:DUF4388 domain-containing protein [Chloracidobacterium sp.]MDW8216051.1 DUF4388 domain-containing protein [Acidobacteriota bacterium]